MLICQYCKSERKNKNSLVQHEIRCKENPNAIKLGKGFAGCIPWNKGFTKETSNVVKRGANRLKERYDLGEIDKKKGWCAIPGHIISKRNKELKTGGYKENAGRSKKYKTLDSFGNRVTLQSSYELKCSKILNDLNIKWIRPRHLKYDGDKKYFPDFHLTEYDIYLDPKNDYLITKDKSKIEKASKQNNKIIYIINEQQLTTEYIGSLVKLA